MSILSLVWLSCKMRLLTTASLALVFPHQEVFKEVAEELQGNVLESKGRAMEQFEQVQVVVEVSQGCRLWGAESRVRAVDDALQVFPRNLSGRDVEREDLEGQIGKGQVLPALPLAGTGNLFWDIQAAIVGETLENDIFKREL